MKKKENTLPDISGDMLRYILHNTKYNITMFAKATNRTRTRIYQLFELDKVPVDYVFTLFEVMDAITIRTLIKDYENL